MLTYKSDNSTSEIQIMSLLASLNISSMIIRHEQKHEHFVDKSGQFIIEVLDCERLI